MTDEIDREIKFLLGSQEELRDRVTGKYAKAVCESNLRGHIIDYLSDGSIADTEWIQLSDDQREELAGACYSILIEEAPQICEYELEEDFGPYPAFIRGVNGCYFLDVLERDPIGPFSDIQLAKKAFEFGFGSLQIKPRKNY